jgi:hypothetical protein
MRIPAPDYEHEFEDEWETLPEMEGEFEGEWELEGSTSRTLRRGGSPRRMRQTRASRKQIVAWVSSLILNPPEEPTLPPHVYSSLPIQGRAPTGQGGRKPESEFESEWEFEGEWEEELNPAGSAYSIALMEHAGHAALEAESEAEAEAFVGALIPLAARVIPRAAPAIIRAAPGLIRGLVRTARVLRRSPATRPWVRALPTIVRRTAVGVARQAAGGRRVMPRTVQRILARQVAQVLSNKAQLSRTLRNSRALDRRYHRAAPAQRRRPRSVSQIEIGDWLPPDLDSSLVTPQDGNRYRSQSSWN